jgi:hypothetical protein
MLKKISVYTIIKQLFNVFHFSILLFISLIFFANKGTCYILQGLARGDSFSVYNLTDFERNAIHIKDFGAIGDGVTNDTKAYQKAAAYLQANGGTLIINPGTYIVGKQRLSGSYSAGSSYFAEPILDIRDAKKSIIITGYGAILKAADGLKYGSFNPITGEKDSIRKAGNTSSYYASAYTFIAAIGCESVSIKGLTLDGNSGNLNIGPGFGPDGIQLSALGIGLYGNKNALVVDCYIHHCALDGIIVAWPGLKDSDPIYSHTLINVTAEYNGRQGLSWVGGNDLAVTNCKFSSTGKALNKGVPVVSKPSAGIDIELENSIIKNGHFTNCYIYDNAGSGVISIAHDTYNINFRNCTFIGTTNTAAYPESQNFSFDSCTFVGMVQRIYGSPDKSKAVSFKDCLFTMDSTLSPNGKVYGNTWEFYDARNATFDHCTFDAGNKDLPTFNTPEITFLNCSFSQNSNKDFNAAAIFKGTTKFVMKGKGKLNSERSSFQGEILYNNQKSFDIKKIKIE